jgi:hypothetical protein
VDLIFACLNWPLAAVIVAAIAGLAYLLHGFYFEVELKDD